MPLVDGWPAQSGVADQIEIRKNLAGLIVRDTTGAARAGVFPRHPNPLVTSTATMNVAVAPFEGAVVRAGGPVFIANDGFANVLLDAAPAANSRIDVIYVRQNENGYGGLADGTNGTVFGVAKGTAAASPTVPTVPAGALPLAQVTIPSTATATNSSGVVITQVFSYTAATGGMFAVRTTAEIASLPTHLAGQQMIALDTGIIHKSNGTAFKPWESEWIVYSATLAGFNLGSGSTPTPSAVTTYKYVAGEVLLKFAFRFSDAGGSAAGPYKFTLPVNREALDHPFQEFDSLGNYFDSSTGVNYRLDALTDGTNVNYLRLSYGLPQITADTGGSVPIPAGGGDVISGRVTYTPA